MSRRSWDIAECLERRRYRLRRWKVIDQLSREFPFRVGRRQLADLRGVLGVVRLRGGGMERTKNGHRGHERGTGELPDVRHANSRVRRTGRKRVRSLRLWSNSRWAGGVKPGPNQRSLRVAAESAACCFGPRQ